MIGRETSSYKAWDQLQGTWALISGVLQKVHLTLGTSFLLPENENDYTGSASFIGTLWD